MDHDRLHLNLNYSWPSIRMILHTHTYQQWRENIVRRWEKDGMRGSRKERTKKFIVAVGIQEGVFSFFNKINYFTLFMSMHCTLFLYKKIHIPNTQFCVFSFKRMLQKYVTKHFFFLFFFCIMSTQKMSFSTNFKSQFLHSFKNQNCNTLTK